MVPYRMSGRAPLTPWSRAEPTHDALVVGSGPNGLAAAIALAPGRPLGARARGRGHGRRRHPLRRAHAPRLPARRLLGRPPAGGRVAVPVARCRSATTASSWCTRRSPLAHPLDDGTAVVLDRSVEATAASIGGADGGAYRTLDGAARRATPAGSCPPLLGPLRPPRHPAPVRALRPERRALRVRPRARALPRARARRALFAGCAAHSMLAPRAAAHGLVRAGARAARPRGGLADRARRLAVDRRRARRPPALARRRDPHGQPGGVASTSCRRPRAAPRPDAAPGAARGRRPAARRLPARARPLPLRPRASSSSTGRSTGRSRGRRPSAAAPGPSTWAARSRRSRRPSATCRTGSVPERPFVLMAQPSLDRPERARPRGSTWRGATATCRPGRRRT